MRTRLVLSHPNPAVLLSLLLIPALVLLSSSFDPAFSKSPLSPVVTEPQDEEPKEPKDPEPQPPQEPGTGEGAEEETAEAKKKKDKRPRLAAEQYLKALEELNTIAAEGDSYTATIQVIPDVYLHELAKKYDSYKKQGLSEEKLLNKLSRDHRSLKSDRGKILFNITFEFFGGTQHFFLEKSLSSHVELDIDGKAGFRIRDLKPKPSYASWRINELDSNRKLKLKLAHLKDFSFQIEPTKERDPKDKTPHIIRFVGFRHYTEVPKRSEYELVGINLVARQLALSSWAETALEDHVVTIYPGEFKWPRPKEEFETILETLSAEE